MKRKILTVVVPTYNMEKYLRNCLDSLIVSEEQMQLLEVLIINDGSKDSSSQIAHEYQDRYPQTFRVIDKENGNYGSCVNRGLKEATGKYIKVLDADDWFDTANFKLYLDKIKDLDVDLILNDAQMVNPEGKKGMSFSLKRHPDGVFNFFPSNEMLEMYQVAYKTENLRKIGYHQTEGISYTDQQWMFKPMTTVRTAYYFSQVLYDYLFGREGQTVNTQIRKKSLNHWVIYIKVMLEMYKEEKYPNDIDNWLRDKLKDRLNGFYRLVLIELMEDEEEHLIEFDSYLKNVYSDIYNMTNDIVVHPLLPIKYISKWRKTRKLSNKKLLNFLFRTYKKIKNGV